MTKKFNVPSSEAKSKVRSRDQTFAFWRLVVSRNVIFSAYQSSITKSSKVDSSPTAEILTVAPIYPRSSNRNGRPGLDTSNCDEDCEAENCWHVVSSSNITGIPHPTFVNLLMLHCEVRKICEELRPRKTPSKS